MSSLNLQFYTFIISTAFIYFSILFIFFADSFLSIFRLAI